jgi:hypothetical protein
MNVSEISNFYLLGVFTSGEACFELMKFLHRTGQCADFDCICDELKSIFVPWARRNSRGIGPIDFIDVRGNTFQIEESDASSLRRWIDRHTT